MPVRDAIASLIPRAIMALNPIKLVVQAVNQTQPIVSEIGKNLDGLKAQAAAVGERFELIRKQAGFGSLDKEISLLAKSLGKTYKEAEQLSKGLGLSSDQIQKNIKAIKELSALKLDPKQIFEKLNKELGTTEEQFNKLHAAANGDGGGGRKGGFGGLGGAISSAAGAMGTFGLAVQGAQAAMAILSKNFDQVIGQNIRLREQIQSTAITLASKQDVLINGKIETDPRKAIDALRPMIKEQIDKLAVDATSLSGVTSTDLIPSFQAALAASGRLKLGNQQGAGKDSADNARQLTTQLTAQGLMLGRDAGQITNDISQITGGNIDPQYNALAKFLNLNNARVAQLSSEGKLMKYIEERTQAAVAGQAQLAEQWKGATSNIQEYVQLITRDFGGPLLDVMLKPIVKLEQSLKGQLENMRTFAKGAGEAIGGGLMQVWSLIDQAIDGVGAVYNKNLKQISGFINDAVQAGSGAWEWLKQAATDVWDYLTEQVKSLAPDLQSMGAELQKNFMPVWEYLVQVLPPALEKIGNFLKAGIIGLIAYIVQGLRNFTTTVKIIAPLLSGITTTLVMAIDGFNISVEKAQQTVASFISIASKIPGVSALIGDPIKDAAEALDSLSRASTQLDTQSLKTLDQVNAAKAQGTNLSAEQLKKNTQIAELAKQQIEAIDQQIASEKELAVFTPEQKAKQQADIAFQENRKKALEEALKGLKIQSEEEAKGTANVTTQNRKLDDRGTIIKQLADKAKAFQEALDNPIDQAAAIESAKQLMAVTQQQIDAGAITAQQGEDRLKAIAKNAGLDIETRQAAEKAITGIRKGELEVQKQNIATQIAEVEAKVKSGNLGEVEGAKQLTALKKKELDLQLKDVDDAIKTEQDLIAKGGGSKKVLAKLQNDRKGIVAQQVKQETEGEESIQAARMAVLERAQRKAIDTAKQSEIERNNANQELLNKHEIRQVEFDRRRIINQRSTIETELQNEKDKLAALEAAPKYDDPAKEAERQAKIRASKIQLSQLTGQLLQNEYEQQQANLRALAEKLDREVQGLQNRTHEQTLGLEKQQQVYDAITRSIEQQKKLMEEQQNLRKAQTDAVLGELNVMEQIAQTESEKRRYARAEEAIKLRALKLQHEAELTNLKIQQQQTELAREREQIELRMKKLQNEADIAQKEANLQKAKADPTSTPEVIRAAELDLKSSQQQGGFLVQQETLLARQAGFDRQSYALQENALRTRQGSEDLQQQYAFANTLQGSQRANAMRQLRNQIAGNFGATGDNSRLDFQAGLESLVNQTANDAFGTQKRNLGGNSATIAQSLLSEAGLSNPKGKAIASRIGQLQQLDLSGSLKSELNYTPPQPGAIEASSDSLGQILTAVTEIANKFGDLDALVQIDQSNQIINQFQGGGSPSRSDMNRVDEQMLSIQYDLLQKIRQRQG
ncbi:MAG: hypothetical protein KME15_19950 [Drouetiella hepatica Uher 2000/2452]|jgi:hypothetical protein|uniref:Uncharacterized protein n=1 Tax=Drouetiella hepatica Uher 2000/2452 TaxID=904376 RepID=A0A951QE81_9CYAN|nr:hypothetical protein [Drouetiella hepatica Uher 2000/2452]